MLRLEPQEPETIKSWSPRKQMKAFFHLFLLLFFLLPFDRLQKALVLVVRIDYMGRYRIGECFLPFFVSFLSVFINTY